MATEGFKQPVYINGLQVGAKVSGAFAPMYDCADIEVAAEIALAMNMLWQTFKYGLPDPALKTEFLSKYADAGYGPEDVDEFFGKFDEIGLVPPECYRQSYSVH